jgi:hypothetical protein
MANLPLGVAAVLTVLATGTYVLCADGLTKNQAWAARIMCQSRHSETGDRLVVIQDDELALVCSRAVA